MHYYYSITSKMFPLNFCIYLLFTVQLSTRLFTVRTLADNCMVLVSQNTYLSRSDPIRHLVRDQVRNSIWPLKPTRLGLSFASLSWFSDLFIFRLGYHQTCLFSGFSLRSSLWFATPATQRPRLCSLVDYLLHAESAYI